MFNIRVESPSGYRSRGYDREDEKIATETHQSVLAQMKELFPSQGCFVVTAFLEKEICRTAV